ncbi:MAG: hypothetical protein JJE07_07350 [Flavobacteriaceae bacterium]|nr:hypothetical protein [Flavobacteriaceae bacterium]
MLCKKALLIIRIDTNGVKILNNKTGVIKIAFSPLKEQSKIEKYLGKKNQTIDKIVAIINTQIAVLKELRKRFLNDVVTGQLKITTNLNKQTPYFKKTGNN